MEGATGIYTGSLYDDSSLTRKGAVLPPSKEMISG